MTFKEMEPLAWGCGQRLRIPYSSERLVNAKSFLSSSSSPPPTSTPTPASSSLALPNPPCVWQIEGGGFYSAFLPESNHWRPSSTEQLFPDLGWEIPPVLQPEVPAPSGFLQAVSIREPNTPAPACPTKGEGGGETSPHSLYASSSSLSNSN